MTEPGPEPGTLGSEQEPDEVAEGDVGDGASEHDLGQGAGEPASEQRLGLAAPLDPGAAVGTAALPLDALDAPEDSVDPAPATRARQLEREGEVAADFLERLLDIADLDGDLVVDVEGDRAAVAIVDSEEGRVPRRLVGTDGKVLEALQELTRLSVQAATGERSRLMLDIAGYRAERRAALVDLARVAIDDVQKSGHGRALGNMTAFERKVVHDEVAAAGLRSESEGAEPGRHVVVLPAD